MMFVPREIAGRRFVGSPRPVYMQEWFTEIAAQTCNPTIPVVMENGKLLGSLQITIERNGVGMKQGYNLPWARLCGPTISEGINEAKRAQIISELVGQLPGDVSYFLTLANESDYKLFLSRGFQPALEYNYVVTPDRLPALRDAFSKMTKRHIRTAEKQLTVSTTTPDAFVDIYAANLVSRRRKPYAPLAIARDLLKEAAHRGQARIFTANRRDTGEIDAAIACLWDDERYYYWMTTRRGPAAGRSGPYQGAVKLLVWSAIQDAAARGLTFDFDGVGANVSAEGNGISKLCNGMGAQPAIRYRVKRETRLERTLGRFRPPIKLVIRTTIGCFMALKLNH
jgi:hypothetical protein